MRILFAAASFAALALALAAAPASAQEPQRIAGALEDSDSQVAVPGPDAEEELVEGQDPTPAANHRYDDHRIRLEAGRRYRLSVNSEAFDPIARLYRAGENEPVAENDDSNESLNSRIVYSPAASGDFILRVTGFSAEARGAYQAEVAALPPLPEPATLYQHMDATIWRTYDGAITSSDPALDGDGRHYDDYRVNFAAGQTRLIWLDAAGFDTLVQVFRMSDREGEPLASDDDSGGGLNSLVAFRAEEAGDYVIRVTSFDGEDGGPYRLRVSER
jgi:hypothetical protein